MRSKFHPEALAEFDDAIDYYDIEADGFGDRFREHIRTAVTEIEESPNAWPYYDDYVRRHLVSVFPYVVLYLEVDDYLLIVAVMHTSRKPDYWRNRIN